MLTVTERVVLVAFDHPGRVLTEATDLTLGYALSGAVIVDLALQGHLEIDGTGFKLNLASQPKDKFLKKAKEILAGLDGGEPVALFKQLYAMNYHLKPLVFDALVQDKFLSMEEIKIKWSFDIRKYSLKAEHTNKIRSQLIESLSHDKLSLNDYCAMQLVASTSLLRDTTDDKHIQKIKRRLNTLARLMGVTQAITDLMDKVLPESIAKSHKLGPIAGKRTYASTWEWRGFWEDNKGPSLLQASLMYRHPKQAFEYSELTDTYLIINGSQDNIKVRKTGVEVKRPIETHNGYTAYYPKQTFKFPFAAKELASVFPRLYAAEEKVETVEGLLSMLRSYDYTPELAELKKKRYQLKLEKQVKLEFSSIEMGGAKYLSACVEGPDYHITHAHVQNFAGSKAIVRNYTQFIREFFLDRAASERVVKITKKLKKKKVK